MWEERLKFLDEFKDPYMQEQTGKGVFLAGVVLGMVARGQAGKGGSIDAAPMFKQIHFGRMLRRDLRHLMGRVPELTRAYHLPYAGMIDSLCGEAGELLMKGEAKELGVEGNFAFSVAFLTAPDHFWKIFKKQTDEGQSEDEQIDDEPQLALFGDPDGGSNG